MFRRRRRRQLFNPYIDTVLDAGGKVISRAGKAYLIKSAGKAIKDEYVKMSDPRRKFKPKPNVSKLASNQRQFKKQLRKLKRMDDATTGTLIYRVNTCYALKSSANAQAVDWSSGFNTSGYESALAYCKFFNPSVPGTLTTADISSGTYQRNILFERVSGKIRMINNYQTRCEVVVYICKVRDDTDQTALAAWQAGILDGSNLTDETDLNQYPTDYNMVNELYKLHRKTKKILKPGQMIEVSHSENDIEYDNSVVDTHALNYQRQYKSWGFMIVIKGCVAHDSAVAAQQGLPQAGIDIERSFYYKVKYSAGLNISYTQVANTYDTFTNGAVESHQPIPDNIGYSIA